MINYTKEVSESLQQDIVTCVDGVLENEGLPIEVTERLKDLLCQIIVDRRST